MRSYSTTKDAAFASVLKQGFRFRIRFDIVGDSFGNFVDDAFLVVAERRFHVEGRFEKFAVLEAVLYVVDHRVVRGGCPAVIADNGDLAVLEHEGLQVVEEVFHTYKYSGVICCGGQNDVAASERL